MRITHAQTALNISDPNQLIDGPAWNADHTIETPWFDVTAYGAVGDGATSDTAAIQSALDAVAADGGGVVYFPPGTYIVTSSVTGATLLTLDSTHIRLCGEGAGLSRIQVADSCAPYFAILAGTDPTLTDLSHLTIDHLTFDHNSTNNPLLSLASVNANPAATVVVYVGTDITFSDNEVIQSSAINNVVVNGTTVERVQIVGNVFSDLGDDGNGVTHDCSVIYTHGTDVVIAHNLISSAGQDSPGATTAIETHGSRTTVANNVLTDWQTGINVTGIDADDDAVIGVTDNVMSGMCFGILLWSAPSGTHTTGYGLSGVSVTGNTIGLSGAAAWSTKNTAHSEGGIVIVGSDPGLDVTALLIDGNVITHPLETVAVTANTASMGIGWWSPADATLSHSRITNNTLTNFPMAGIRLSCQIDGVVVDGNSLVNCGSTLDSTITGTSAYRMPIFIGGTTITQLEITRNSFRDALTSSTRPQWFLYLFQDATSVGRDLTVIDNSFVSTGSAMTGQIFLSNAGGGLVPLLRGAITDFVPLTQSAQVFALGSWVIDPATGTPWTLQSDGYNWRSWMTGFPYGRTLVGVPRLGSSGTPIVAGDVTLTGWGTGATATVGGTDMAPIIQITAGTGPTANPTAMLTYHDGAYNAGGTFVAAMNGGNGVVAHIAGASVAGSLTLTYVGTPVNGFVYQLHAIVIGHTG